MNVLPWLECKSCLFTDMTIEESFNKREEIKASYKVSEEFVYCLGQVWSYHIDLDEIFWPWTVF